jgi:hypothetical protein
MICGVKVLLTVFARTLWQLIHHITLLACSPGMLLLLLLLLLLFILQGVAEAAGQVCCTAGAARVRSQWCHQQQQ